MPTSASSSTLRDQAGRFVPGQSGNPSGKAPGTRNRATLLRELMAEGEDAAIVRFVLDKAKGGDAVAARFVVAHLCPRPRPEGRRIEIALPEGAPAHNVVAAHDAVLRALFAGEIAPDEAESVTRVLDARSRALNAWRLENAMMRYRPGFPALPARAGTGQEGLGQERMAQEDLPREDTIQAHEAGPAPGPSPGVAGAARDEERPANSSPTCISPAKPGSPTAAPASSRPPAAPGDDLHSACIERDSQAMTPERQESALALLAALTALHPPVATTFDTAEDSA
jgi:hypothetical protein